MSRRKLLVSLAICLSCLVIGTEARAANLTLAWDSEANVAGYIVSYGTQSGVYTARIDVGNATVEAVPSLADGTTYYFVVQAYDSLGNMSAPSIEVIGQTSAYPSQTPLSIMCPIPTGSSSDGNPVGVSFSDPSTSGGTAPVTTSCSPSSGSSFSVGTTSLTCTATDAAQTTATCTSSVVVSGPGVSTPASTPSPTPYAPPTPAALPNSGGGSSSPAPSGPPTYQIAPPPGAFGFSNHGYYRPDGGWQETPLVGGSPAPSSNRAAPASGGGLVGTPTYQVPPPLGSFGFSNHGYYRPDGGWQETAMIGGGVPAPTSAASGGSTPSYQMAPPPGSFGFNSHGYYRPDGGWQETAMMGTASVSPRGAAAVSSVPLASPSSATPTTVTASNSQGYYRPDGGWQQVSTVSPLSTAPVSNNGSSLSSTGTGSSVFSVAASPSSTPAANSAPSPASSNSVTPATPSPAPSANVRATSLSLAPAAAPPTLTNASSGTGTILVVSAPSSVAPAPWASNDPSPADGATGQNSNVTASWTADGNALSFDVYFGKISNPPLLTQGLTRPTVTFRSLAGNTTYYWRVVAKSANGETTSDTWTFKTGSPQ